MRAGRAFPVAGSNQHLSVAVALAAVELVNRHTVIIRKALVHSRRALDTPLAISNTGGVASLELKGIHKVFQKTPEEAICAVETVNCAVADGELVTVLGPSGCGKTTLLRLIGAGKMRHERNLAYGRMGNRIDL